MNHLYISLFGKFCVTFRGETELAFESKKVQELFFYLLLHAKRPHTREKLAEILWQDSSPTASKKYLRHTLWQLQSTLDDVSLEHDMLLVDTEWIQINPNAIYWLDTQIFETAYRLAQNTPGSELSPVIVQELIDAVLLYKGDLLENWYHEWCLFERERLQNLYLTLLFKLMVYCEYAQEYETGIMYGMKMLKCDQAREQTYRQLMRLHFLADDRIGALRQFERCKLVLQQELNVNPAQRTLDLVKQIRQGVLSEKFSKRTALFVSPALVSNLNRLKDNLATAQQQVDHHINILKDQNHLNS